jgi:hypothetical protein
LCAHSWAISEKRSSKQNGDNNAHNDVIINTNNHNQYKENDSDNQYCIDDQNHNHNHNNDDNDKDGNDDNDNDDEDEDDERLTPSEKREIGFQAKRLIDVGRVRYLQNQNFNSSLFYYVDENISPENVLLVAIRSKI